MGKARFPVETVTLELAGEEYVFSQLTMGALESLVEEFKDEGENALNAALIRASSQDGKLKDVTAEELTQWPVKWYRKVQRVLSDLNNLGDSGGR